MVHIKHSKSIITSLALLAPLLLSLAFAPTAHAMTKAQFTSAICGGFTGDEKTDCRKDAEDGNVKAKWHGKAVKFSDWKDKSVAKLKEHLGISDAEPDGGGGGGSSATEKCGDVDTAIDYGCSGSGNPIFGVLLAIINFLAVGVGIAVVGGIIYGAIRYASANGNSAQTQQAIKIIVNAVLGLVLFGFMYALLNYLVPGGALN